MSIRLMAQVWDETDVEGTDLLVLLCLADHAGDDGECWPSVGRIAKRARRSERVVQKAMARLERKGLLRRDLRPGRSTIYHVTPIPEAPPSDVRPVASDTTPRSPVTPRTVSEPPLSTDPVVKEVDNSLDEPSISPDVPSSGQGTPLPLVRRRQLIAAGVTEDQGPLWEQAWLTATTMVWPEGMEMEARQFPDEHLSQHVSQSVERGFVLSPSRWLRFYISDRYRQMDYARARLEQEARVAEDPSEREARQNRHLPPDRTDLDMLDPLTGANR